MFYKIMLTCQNYVLKIINITVNLSLSMFKSYKLNLWIAAIFIFLNTSTALYKLIFTATLLSTAITSKSLSRSFPIVRRSKDFIRSSSLEAVETGKVTRILSGSWFNILEVEKGHEVHFLCLWMIYLVFGDENSHWSFQLLILKLPCMTVNT